MFEVNKRTSVCETLEHEFGRILEPLLGGGHYVGTVTTRTHTVVREERITLPRPHPVVHQPPRLGAGRNFFGV